jgi:hypothetical protein
MALGDSTSSLNIGLPSFSPTPGYPGLCLDRHTCPACALHNGIHTFNHCLLQPALGLFASILVALDDHLVVADKYRDGSGTLASALPQEGVYFSEYTNRRGDKSARRVFEGLLALLALPHT